MWLVPWVAVQQDKAYPRGDWIWLELGARVLFHHHAPLSGGPSLDVYANNSIVQMGPPALVVGGPLMWLPPHVEAHLAGALMALAILPILWCLERAAVSRVGRDSAARRLLLVAIPVVPAWAIAAESWEHLDDVLALICLAGAVALLSTGRREVLAGVLLGTGAAAKPWAAILLPLLLLYPRPQVPRAVLSFVASALAWWAPFIAADPGTVHALGSLRLFMVHQPTWRLVGLTGRAPAWIRPLQLLGGVVLSWIVGRRMGWAAVPLLALSWRVTSDPYDWPYYVMGPLVGAALWDLARPAARRIWALPWATASVLLVACLVPRELPNATPGIRLAWFLGLVTAVALISRRGSAKATPERSVPAPSAVAVRV